jgi:hypothetical protein
MVNSEIIKKVIKKREHMFMRCYERDEEDITDITIFFCELVLNTRVFKSILNENFWARSDSHHDILFGNLALKC